MGSSQLVGTWQLHRFMIKAISAKLKNPAIGACCTIARAFIFKVLNFF